MQSVVLAALALAVPAGAAAEPRICNPGALRILVTGDDGYQAPGIRAAAAAMRARGHEVALVATAENASGSSMSFSWNELPVSVESKSPLVAAVAGGTPANAVVLAVTALYPGDGRPDLVISGINDGTNLGALLPLSGTVGAAAAAALLLDPPVPAIALNAARMPGTDEQQRAERFAAVARHFSSELMPRLRRLLCEEARAGDSPAILNVNYPARPVAGLPGVRAASADPRADLEIHYERGQHGTYLARRSARGGGLQAWATDRSLLAAGYVTVTPLVARYVENPATLDRLTAVLAAPADAGSTVQEAPGAQPSQR